MKKLMILALVMSLLTTGCSSGSSGENPEVPCFTLNSGYRMPMLGLGTWTQDNATAEESVYTAIREGYRLIDTARYYGNEEGVGRGVRRAIDEGLEVDVLPGASAVLPAILMSGLSPQPFMFMGFPPEKSGERIKLFESVKNFPFTLCFYISPHKAEKNILDMLEVFGDRKASLIREISKIFQEAIRGTLSQILERVHEGLKGELVLVIEGGKSEADNDLWKSEALKLKEEGESVKDIVKAISEKYHVPKNEIKKFILEV